MTARLVLAGIDCGRPLTGPETLHIDITNGCNTNCVTCWDHSPLLTVARSAVWKRARVELAAVEALLDDALSLGGLRAIVLSGMGEPFTHPDIYRIAAAVKRRGLHLTIITNLVAADVEQVLELGIDQLLIGVQGATEESYRAFHPSFRGDEWQRLHHALESFRLAGRRYKHVQVICDVNAHELAQMVELAHRYDAAGLNFKLASLKDGTERCRISDEQRRLLETDLVPAARLVASQLGVHTNLEVFSTQLRAGGDDTAPIAEIGCFMGYSYARVLVDGTVLYCCNTEIAVGSLARSTFADLWHGARWNALRDQLRRGEYFASCAQCGKFNQNVALGRRFAAVYGEARLREATGR